MRRPARVAPSKWRVSECPTCGHPRRVANGAWLRFKRETAGLDQRSFGKLLGISGPYVSDLENNRRECPWMIQKEYAKLKG